MFVFLTGREKSQQNPNLKMSTLVGGIGKQRSSESFIADTRLSVLDNIGNWGGRWTGPAVLTEQEGRLMSWGQSTCWDCLELGAKDWEEDRRTGIHLRQVQGQELAPRTKKLGYNEAHLLARTHSLPGKRNDKWQALNSFLWVTRRRTGLHSPQYSL